MGIVECNMTTLKIPINNKKHGVQWMTIDEEDFDKIKDFNLTLNYTSNPHTFYCQHTVYKECKYVKRITMHRHIMGLGDFKNDKRIINHKDGNGLNNCKTNLEICDHMHNSQTINRMNVRDNVKSYYFENDPKRKCKWRVVFKKNGKCTSKRFMTEKECIEYVNKEHLTFKN